MSETSEGEPTQSWTRAIGGSPIVQTLVLMAVATAATWQLGPIESGNPLVLAAPLSSEPWTILTSVYAHRSLGHLAGNAIVIGTAGTLVALATSTARFHAFVLGTGAIAGVTTVLVAPLLGPPGAVLGASGAAFGLVGYLLAANRVSTFLFDRVSRRTVILLGTIIGIGIVIWLGGLDLAIIGHATGAAIGFVAGRLGVLAR